MTVKAGDLKDILAPSNGVTVDGEKTLTLRIIPGQRPSVVFSGFWTGKYIKAAMDSIAKAYRLTRRRVLPSTLEVMEKEQLNAEGRK